MNHAWKYGQIKDLIESLDSGVSVNGEDRIPTSHEPSVLKVSAVTYGIFNPQASKPILEEELKRAKCNPKIGHIIISRSNTPDLVGASAYIDRDYPDRYLPDKLWQTVPKKDVGLDMRWLAYFLASPRARYRLSSLATGTSSSMKNITKSELLALPLTIPTLPEQTAIANILSTWDTAIEKTEKLIAAKQKYHAALLYKLITQQLEKWEHLRAEKIFKTVSKKNNDGEALLSVTQDKGVIPRSMLKGRVMSPQGRTDSYKLIQPGDFAISLRSFQGGIEHSNYRGIISPAYTVLRPQLTIYNDFYRHFFKTNLFINKYLNIAVIGIRDGKQISIPDFNTVKIPYPPLGEQNRIAEILNVAKRDINALQQLTEAYRKQKLGLMQKLLTGKWCTRPLEIAVEQ